MKLNVFYISTLFLLLSCTFNKLENTIILPNGFLDQNYETKLKLSSLAIQCDFLHINIQPEDKDINIRPTDKYCNELIIYGTPKNIRTYSINIEYYDLMVVGFRESFHKKNYMLSIK